MPADTYWLYQQYPYYGSIMNDGVKNEHFIVWMRTAALPRFRKLYGRIDTLVVKGTVLTFDVNARACAAHW